MTRLRDDKLRASIGIHEDLMDDMGTLADIFIGNENIAEFTPGTEYRPLTLLVSEFHFDPGNETLKKELLSRIKMVEKMVSNLSAKIDSNFKKAKYIYRNS